MLSRLLSGTIARRLSPSPSPTPRWPRWRADLSSVGRRLAHFWFVWTVLVSVHEAGHAIVGWQQGRTVRRVTVGAGPVLRRWQHGETEAVLRLVPLAGITTLTEPRAGPRAGLAPDAAWRGQLAMLGGGILATLGAAIGLAVLVAARERRTRERWVWGRMVVADAVVLTVFNLLPVPPLDGGRALITVIGALRESPLSSDTLLWVQIGGFALAVVPMTLWTSWTARIDRTALWWRAPAS